MFFPSRDPLVSRWPRCHRQLTGLVGLCLCVRALRLQEPHQREPRGTATVAITAHNAAARRAESCTLQVKLNTLSRKSTNNLKHLAFIFFLMAEYTYPLILCIIIILLLPWLVPILTFCIIQKIKNPKQYHVKYHIDIPINPSIHWLWRGCCCRRHRLMALG